MDRETKKEVIRLVLMGQLEKAKQLRKDSTPEIEIPGVIIYNDEEEFSRIEKKLKNLFDANGAATGEKEIFICIPHNGRDKKANSKWIYDL